MTTDRTPATNKGLAKVSIQCYEDTFVLKIGHLFQAAKTLVAILNKKNVKNDGTN